MDLPAKITKTTSKKVNNKKYPGFYWKIDKTCTGEKIIIAVLFVGTTKKWTNILLVCYCHKNSSTIKTGDPDI